MHDLGMAWFSQLASSQVHDMFTLGLYSASSYEVLGTLSRKVHLVLRFRPETYQGYHHHQIIFAEQLRAETTTATTC